ncbi:ribonuclease domain-containing protein [Kitasatospora sp. NBC_01300]|uniref:ribonuclease domain-containing protein n=1 Tax=Kitasatospora sp. NBC_01300 TaxID=2903574 RepID=UPI00352E56E8|nr:guanine-specific ribonuclease N1 and T1 [Kitasatospora sp. NBC_01300]
MAAAALFLTAATVPSAAPAGAAAPAAHPAPRIVRGIVEPPLPVDQLPPQVEEACHIWHDLHWPTANAPRDYPVADSPYVIRGSNVYGNRSGDLPQSGHYREYDVNPRSPGQHRDAERLVRDPGTQHVWYSDDHYANFHEIGSGCS